MFTDPAANLYFGNGFTSSAWSVQTRNEFWAGNAPLYSILLYYWMQLFGFSIVAVRSLNNVLMTVSALMLWVAVIKLNLVTATWSRVALIALLFSGYGTSWCARSGRYDALGITLFAASILIYSIPLTWLRCVLLTCIGMFLPMAGLNLLPYAVIFCSLLFIYLGKPILKECFCVAIGIIIGILFLYILFSTNGVWNDFVASARGLGGHPGLPNFKNSSKDISFLILLFLSLGLFLSEKKHEIIRFRSPLSFGLTSGFTIPMAMLVLGRYPTNYSWMAYIPLSICVCSAISKFNPSNWKRFVIIGVLSLACFFGLPFWLTWSIYGGADLDYKQVEALVERNVKENDWVYSNSSTFYAMKSRSNPVFFEAYSFNKSTEEKNKISLLILNPNDYEKESRKVGGKWYPSGDGIKPKQPGFLGLKSSIILSKYNLQVYRRENAKNNTQRIISKQA